jgi:hypothetical protein
MVEVAATPPFSWDADHRLRRVEGRRQRLSVQLVLSVFTRLSTSIHSAFVLCFAVGNSQHVPQRDHVRVTNCAWQRSFAAREVTRNIVDDQVDL